MDVGVEVTEKEISLRELRGKRILFEGTPTKDRNGLLREGVYFAFSVPDGELFAIEISEDGRREYKVRDSRVVNPSDRKAMLRYAFNKGQRSGYVRINAKVRDRLRRYFEGRLLTCKSCGYEWSSLSHSRYYVVCPRCGASVPVKREVKE